MAVQTQISDIGEQGLLKLVQSFCPRSVVGDDGAIADISPGYKLVVTTDVLVDGVHFSDRTTTPEDVGWRAAAVNLSDLAAMGATPMGITVGLSLPPATYLDWVEGVYRGLAGCLACHGGEILGGDITRSSVATIAITALGQVRPANIIQRSQAQVGDAIIATGPHGRSRAGLEILLGNSPWPSLPIKQRQILTTAHCRPKPRFDILPYLKSYRRVAGMDSSDGLADAVIQICRASRVGAVIDYQKLSDEILCSLGQPLEFVQQWQLYGGEDFELILTLPRSQAEELVQKLDNGAKIIGSIQPGQDVTMINGVNGTIKLNQAEGYQHFQID